MPENTIAPLVVPQVGEHGAERDSGYLHGRAAGYAAGLRQAEAEVAEKIAALEAEHQAASRAQQERLQAALQALTRAHQQAGALAAPVLTQAQQTITAATLRLARAVVGIELCDEPTRAKAALARAMATTETDQVLAIHLSPQDLAILDPEQLEATGVAVHPDETLAPGDARTELVGGYLDARVQAALERASAALERLR